MNNISVNKVIEHSLKKKIPLGVYIGFYYSCRTLLTHPFFCKDYCIRESKQIVQTIQETK